MHELLLIIVQSWSFQLLHAWNPTVACTHSQQLMPPNEGVAKIDIGTKWPTAVNSACLMNVSYKKACQAQATTIFINVSQEHYNNSLGIFWALACVKKKKSFFLKRFEKHFLPFSERKDLLLGDQLSSPFRQSRSRKDLRQPSFSHILYPAHGWLVLTIYVLCPLCSKTKPSDINSALQAGEVHLTLSCYYVVLKCSWGPHRHSKHGNMASILLSACPWLRCWT